MKVISENKIYDVIECKSFFKKFKGFMFDKKQRNYGLCFNNCSIHTFFCLQPLDIIFLDKDFNVLFFYSRVKSNRIIFKKKDVKYILEFSSDLLDLENIVITF